MQESIKAVCMWQKGSGLKERYMDRLKAFGEWKKKQKIDDQLKPGDKVDILDREGIWCVGNIELIIKSEGRQPLFYIHYENWNRKFDEYIYLTSKRLSPYGFYTSRTDIPRYCIHRARNLLFQHHRLHSENGMTQTLIASNREE